MKRDDQTKEYFCEILNYDPETGKISWRSDRKNGAKAGDEAGHTAVTDGIEYRSVCIDGVSRRVHRIVWLMFYGKWPEGTVDHRNGNGLDNRIKNLRDVTEQQNQRNKRKCVKNKSGVTGVHWCDRSRKWIAQISDGGKRIYIGRFDDFSDAVSARKDREKSLGYLPGHGEQRDWKSYEVKPKGTVLGEGVRYSTRDKMWNARCTMNGTRIFIGHFSTEEEAIQARVNVLSGKATVSEYRKRFKRTVK